MKIILASALMTTDRDSSFMIKYQSIPSLTIQHPPPPPWAKPQAIFLMVEFPNPWAKKEFKPPKKRAKAHPRGIFLNYLP